MKIWMVTASSDSYSDVYMSCFTDETVARTEYDDNTPLDGDKTQISLWSFDTATSVKERVAVKYVGEDDKEE